MFLISSADFASASALRRSEGLEANTEKERPEPDSLSLMNNLLGQFNFLSHRGSLIYDQVLSEVPVESGSSTLRAVGGATYRARSEAQAMGVALGTVPLLDGLAQGLIGKALSSVDFPATTGSLSAPRRTIWRDLEPREEDVVPLYELFVELNKLSLWRNRPFLSHRTQRQWKCGVLFGLQWLTLTVIANVNGSGVPFEISSIDLSRPKKVSESERLRVDNGLTAAIEDQNRRIKLADLYGKTPLAPAIPAYIRAKLKAVLEDMGIPNGSYSREGFSSGRFPYGRTVASIEGRKHSGNSIIFERCSCGAVESVHLLNCSDEQKRFFRNFSKSSIRPWHLSICPHSKEKELDGFPSPFVSRRKYSG